MFWHWWKQQNSTQIIGLDIGPESIKLLKLNTAQNPYLIENFLISPLPAGAVTKNQIVNTSSVADTLKNMFKTAGIKSKTVALAIPCSTAVIKNITLDNRLTSSEIEARSWLEANRHFPDLVSDIYLDFTVIGPSAEDPTQVEVMLVACRKDQINPYLEVCKLAGLTAKIVDINSNALERTLRNIMHSKAEWNTCAILNLDFNLSTLVVIQKDKLLYAHDQTFDGYRITKQSGENASPNDETYLNHLKETLGAHLRHSMHFLYASRPGLKIDHIIISGDCASVPMLDLFVQQEIGIHTEIADPFAGWSAASEVDATSVKKHAAAFALCSGLALAELEQQENDNH